MANFVRLVGRLLQTPIHRFRHPENGRQIIAISVSHVGDPRYFQELRAVLDREDAAGAEIHVEGTQPVDRSSVTDDERAVLSRLDEARKLDDRFQGVSGRTRSGIA